MGNCKLLEPTPQTTADESRFMNGISHVIISHSTTPYDLQLEKTLHVYYNTTLYDLQLEKHYMFIIIQLHMIYN
jgi:hypothetical protein